jgi:hypothetical protein
MDKRDDSPHGEILMLVVAIAAFTFELAIFIIAAASGRPEIIAVFAGAYFACVTMWAIVRVLNCRHDPRYAKPPPDAP